MATKNLMTDFEKADGFDRNFLLCRAIDEEWSYVSGRMDERVVLLLVILNIL
jgi:hypothetical protein